jgi:hypothetical protein
MRSEPVAEATPANSTTVAVPAEPAIADGSLLERSASESAGEHRPEPAGEPEHEAAPQTSIDCPQTPTTVVSWGRHGLRLWDPASDQRCYPTRVKLSTAVVSPDTRSIWAITHDRKLLVVALWEDPIAIHEIATQVPVASNIEVFADGTYFTDHPPGHDVHPKLRAHWSSKAVTLEALPAEISSIYPEPEPLVDTTAAQPGELEWLRDGLGQAKQLALGRSEIISLSPVADPKLDTWTSACPTSPCKSALRLGKSPIFVISGSCQQPGFQEWDTCFSFWSEASGMWHARLPELLAGQGTSEPPASDYFSAHMTMSDASSWVIVHGRTRGEDFVTDVCELDAGRCVTVDAWWVSGFLGAQTHFARPQEP